MKAQFFQSLKRCVSTNVTELLTKDSTLTRVRIWKSGYFAENGEFRHTSVGYSLLKSMSPFRRANIGHVSLETKDFYASLWPERLTIFNKYKAQDALISDIETDLASEGRPPDHLVDLKTLNLADMQKELDRFVQNNQYHLIGGNTVLNANNAASCSSLAHDLLVAGGIRKLVPFTVSIRDCLLVTPNNLTKMVLQAKNIEDELITNNQQSSANTNIK